jgi:VRR-NUC domain
MEESSLASCYLSRRARGKAFERLIIDYIHVVRRTFAPTKNVKDIASGKNNNQSKAAVKKHPSQPSAADIVNRLTEPLLRSDASTTGRITFAAIRTLARRLKQPLSMTLKDMNLYETSQLGHCLLSLSPEEECLSKYSDWRPVTDTAVANAMAAEHNAVGGRCAYIGFEEDEQNSLYVGSLNVEQLAMEYYYHGKLPLSDTQTDGDPSTKGGWIGYHDEGGSVRALFRILSCELLGMDHASTPKKQPGPADAMTIHLTPYQGSPFDLHVGAELITGRCVGIYQRQKEQIESFLLRISSLDASGISDLVFDSIKRRLDYARISNHMDRTLERDVTQARTLSMLAAGFGGKMLASVFRCLLFDYRHYSGGFPDLTLFRALYIDTGELVNLGEWVGEKFTNEYQASLQAAQAAQILGDEEFLGCSKIGDSGGRSTNRFNRSPGRSSGPSLANQNLGDDGPVKEFAMPDRLGFQHAGQAIQVECMCVEVKSQNDRLDPRQEDWLNILSQHGNARVCKFEKPKKLKGKIKGDMKSENSRSQPIN